MGEEVERDNLRIFKGCLVGVVMSVIGMALIGAIIESVIGGR